MKYSNLIRACALLWGMFPVSLLGAQQSDVLRQNAACIHCHVERRGPFVYEHEVIKTEGCVSCHNADTVHKHHPMTSKEINVLCWRCHAPSTSATTGMAVSHVHDDRSKACTDCHRSVHGSNNNALFLHAPRK